MMLQFNLLAFLPLRQISVTAFFLEAIVDIVV